MPRSTKAEPSRAHIATELVDGTVYAMSPQCRPYGFAKDELAYRIRRALEADDSSLHVATEQSIEIAPYNEPQRNMIVTSQPRGAGAIPASTITPLVELSITTLEFDTVDKGALYAATSIPEYWVVDVNGRVIRQMWPGRRALCGTAHNWFRRANCGGDHRRARNRYRIVVIDHVTFGVSHFARSCAFYDAAFAPLGIARLATFEIGQTSQAMATMGPGSGLLVKPRRAGSYIWR